MYRCQLSQAETGWSVTVQYGRRNSTLTPDTKIERVTYEEAKKVYDRTVREKVAKGYQPSALSSQPAAPPLTNSRGPVSHEIVFQPELLTRITELEAERFASNPRYVFQTKQDGDRLTIRKDGERIYGFNKLGQVVRLDPNLHTAIARLCEIACIGSVLIDGEWEPTGYYAWEMLELSIGGIPGDMRANPYWDRWQALESVFHIVGSEPEMSDVLHLTSTCETTEGKRSMLADGTKEGVCVKDRCAPFRPGRNGQHKKFKFEQTASFIVGEKPRAKANDGHRSVALYIIDPEAKWHSDWQPEGAASPVPVRFVATVKVADRYEVPAVGSVVEVRYLYAYPGGGIAQPCYFGKVRTDVRHADCTTAQLKFKHKGEEEE